MRAIFAGLAAFALAQPVAASAQDGERLVSSALPGFVLGYSAANTQQSIREEVRRGETVQRWTRMVTTQRFTGLAGRSSPASYARTIIGQVPQSCPGATTSPVASLTVSGRPASRFQIDCPRSAGAGGAAETFILLAVAGHGDMHVKQVAFRGVRTAADIAWAQGFLASTRLCGAGDRTPACR